MSWGSLIAVSLPAETVVTGSQDSAVTWQSQPSYLGDQAPFAASVSEVSSGRHIKARLAAGMDSFIRSHSLYLLTGRKTNQKESQTNAG